MFIEYQLECIFENENIMLLFLLAWFKEYEELNDKIYQYQLEEQRLQEKMSVGGGSPPPSPTQTQPHIEPMLSPAPPTPDIPRSPQLPIRGGGGYSPYNSIKDNCIKVHLPNCMDTKVRDFCWDLLFFMVKGVNFSIFSVYF